MKTEEFCPDGIWEQGRDLLAAACEKKETLAMYDSLNEEFEAAAKEAAAETLETGQQRELADKRNALAIKFLPLIRNTASSYAYRNDRYDPYLYDDLCQEGWFITQRLLVGHEEESCEQIAKFLKFALRPRIRHIAFNLRFNRELYLEDDPQKVSCYEDGENASKLREAELMAELDRMLDTQEERTLVKLLTERHSVREIAAKLGITKSSAQRRIDALRKKLAPFKKMLQEA